MSNQKSAINELHTGIFTFVVTLYTQHCQVVSKETAKEKVVEYLRDLADYFEAYEPTNTDN